MDIDKMLFRWVQVVYKVYVSEYILGAYQRLLLWVVVIDSKSSTVNKQDSFLSQREVHEASSWSLYL